MPDEGVIDAQEGVSCCLPVEDLHAEPEESNLPPLFEAITPAEPDGSPPSLD